MESLTPATKAWAVLGAGIMAYELACPDGQTLSEGVDRALERRKWPTIAAIGLTALHLVNALPEQLDPFSRVLKTIKETL